MSSLPLRRTVSGCLVGLQCERRWSQNCLCTIKGDIPESADARSLELPVVRDIWRERSPGKVSDRKQERRRVVKLGLSASSARSSGSFRTLTHNKNSTLVLAKTALLAHRTLECHSSKSLARLSHLPNAPCRWGFQPTSQ